ncbi:MAG: heme-binding protein [Alphaproteobacteria bacterium]|nr:heme-binding protein [Alphaproteobacteria bacterium]
MRRWVVAFVTLAGAAAATPEPSYTTVLQQGPFAVRAYPAQLAADLTLTGENASLNRAFRILADYIFTEYPEGKIGMTAPVTVNRAIGMTAPVTTSQSEGQVFMRFFMPARYTSATLPKPRDARINIVEVPARRVAVVQFSWWLTDAAAAKQEGLLRNWLSTNKLKPIGKIERQVFNDPFTLPWNRRNELWIPLQK